MMVNPLPRRDYISVNGFDEVQEDGTFEIVIPY